MSMAPEYKRSLKKYGISSNIDDFIAKLLLDKEDKGNYNPPDNNTFPCIHGWIDARILASGDVVFCCECVEQPIGNIHEESFREIWFSEGYALFRKKAFKYGCIDWNKGRINCVRAQDGKALKYILRMLKCMMP
jgi:MoaA/NifB/PqqE/SkfB family radical SAM enzyme